MKELDVLVDEFASCVIAQWEAIEAGNARKAETFARRYLAAWETLRAQGNSGRDALMVLLEHDVPLVRVAAAAFLLRYATTRARAVLEIEARGTDMLGFRAQQALARWDEGTWALDDP
jgi:hypothetical protein